MFQGDAAGTGPTIISLAPVPDVARAFARCLPGLRSQMRLLRWTSLGIFVVLGVLPPNSFFGLFTLLTGAALIVWLTSTDGLSRYYVTVVRKTPSLTIPQTVTSEPGGLRFLDHESDRWYAWRRWESVDDAPEGIVLVLRGGWQADLLHASAFATPADRTAWLVAAQHGIAGPAAQPD
jgi:hypothetical protein